MTWSLSRLGAAIVLIAAACDSTVYIGARVCQESPPNTSPAPGDGGAADAATQAAVFDIDSAVQMPWSTGFEDGFCEFTWPGGFCFATGTGSYALVTSPVHSGQYAAAFTVSGDGDAGNGQARCVTEGIFPTAAYFGAWYYVPSLAQNTGDWNLFHYQGAVHGQNQHYLWDVSLGNFADSGALHLTFLDFLTGKSADTTGAPAIPIGDWFHLEVYFKRGRDASGAFSVYLNGAPALAPLTGLTTDDTDWGSFYVGNLATALAPQLSTVYVDDVTISLDGP
jgi:hypothetical protein